MADINTITMSGNLTRDPELRYTQAGTAVCSFTIASNGIPYNEKEQVIFKRCSAWNKTAEVIAEYSKKGDNLAVTGELRDSSYTKDDGTKVQADEILVRMVKLPSKAANQRGNTNNQNQSYSKNSFAGSGQLIDIYDDQLPF